MEQASAAMTAAISLIVLLVVLGSSIAVAAGMGLVGVILNQLYSPMPRPSPWASSPGRRRPTSS